jgi:hypothetical protein
MTSSNYILPTDVPENADFATAIHMLESMYIRTTDGKYQCMCDDLKILAYNIHKKFNKKTDEYNGIMLTLRLGNKISFGDNYPWTGWKSTDPHIGILYQLSKLQKSTIKNNIEYLKLLPAAIDQYFNYHQLILTKKQEKMESMAIRYEIPPDLLNDIISNTNFLHYVL